MFFILNANLDILLERTDLFILMSNETVVFEWLYRAEWSIIHLKVYMLNFINYHASWCNVLYYPYQFKHEISRDMQGLHWCRWYNEAIHAPCLSTCT